MANRLNNKVAIISGGARGMGAGHAEIMAREGARVVTFDLLDDLGNHEAERLRGDGLDITYFHGDVTNSADWADIFASAESQYGPVTTLVNNAGVIGSMLGAEHETDDAWNMTLAINQTGVFYGMRHAIPAMRRAGNGSIINICSIWGVSGVGNYLAYQATKGAVRMMTRSTAITHAKENIRANNICPGLIMTEMAIEEGAENNAALLALTPMGRGAAPSEVSHAVVYLASDESSYVTGSEIVVDGGYLAQ